MDHDSDSMLLRKIVRFLDANDPQWRDEGSWRTGGPRAANVSGGDGGAGMLVDDDYTREQRALLGLDSPGDEPKSDDKTIEQKTDEELEAERIAAEQQQAAG